MKLQRRIALLRAINVGGHIVRMEQLRESFESLGFTGVETFIASGNVIFESKATDGALIENRIEQYLELALGYAVTTFVRTPAELAAVARHVPFPAIAQDDTLYVAFLKTAPGPAQCEKLLAVGGAYDSFHVHGREAYWLRRGTPGESRLTGATIEKALGMAATARNITTVNRLVAKYCSDRQKEAQ